VSVELGRLDADESPALVASIVLFPEIAQAALKAKEHGKVANWGLLRAHDRQGSGRLPLREAQRLISLGRGVSGRQARRLLAGGDGQYWEQDPGGHVRYFRPARVAQRLGAARCLVLPLWSGRRPMTPRDRSRPQSAVLVGVRCPHCRRLIALVSPGAVVQTVCPRCTTHFERTVPEPRPAP
jgi:phage FluMu protein Com